MWRAALAAREVEWALFRARRASLDLEGSLLKRRCRVVVLSAPHWVPA
jgi:hypothetical protein